MRPPIRTGAHPHSFTPSHIRPHTITGAYLCVCGITTTHLHTYSPVQVHTLLDDVVPHTHYIRMNKTSRPLIIACASPKGGVGKSTSCLNIAGAICAHGYPVHIIDLDQTQSLYRWYTHHQPDIAELSVESVPETEFIQALKTATSRRQGFILIDVAGALGQAMIQAATIADLTITPTKLSELDLLEANKLHQKILKVAEQVGTFINHRILINEVASLLPGYQLHALAQIEAGTLPHFETLIRNRAPYAESFMTGQPPHYANRDRPPVRKAVEEIDVLLGEVFAALGMNQQKAAA